MKNKSDYLKIKSRCKYSIFLFLYFILYPFCKLLYGRKNIWLICERGNDAQDNGFIFYKYIAHKHTEIQAYFLINESSPEYSKVSMVGRVVNFCSFKHFLMAIGCSVKISSQLFGYAPWVQMNTYLRRNKTKDKHIFLQHGIIKNHHEGLYGDVCKSLDLFVCGAKPEYDFINNNFHYKNDVPQYTGLARYDLLIDFKTKNQIVFMPTWRAKLSNASDEDFLNSDFYQYWSRLSNNVELMNICKNNNLIIKFYLHYSLQKYSHLFNGNEVVKIVRFGEEVVQDLLKESKLLVTDFSSVYFDFGYMRKPVVYFQFDEATFNDEHYTKGYFDYRRDGFGDVCLKTEEAAYSIIKIIENNFAVEDKYLKRMDANFIYRDNKNCERIYNRICELLEKK